MNLFMIYFALITWITPTHHHNVNNDQATDAKYPQLKNSSGDMMKLWLLECHVVMRRKGKFQLLALIDAAI